MFNDKKFQEDFNAYMVNVKPSDKLVSDTIAMLHKEQQRLNVEKSVSKESRLNAFLANPMFRRYSALACTVLLSIFAVKLYNSTIDDKVPVAPIENPVVTTTVEETTSPLDDYNTTDNLLEVTSITSGTSYLNSYDDYVTTTNTLKIDDNSSVTSTVGVSIMDVATTTTTPSKFEFVNGTTTTTSIDYNNVTSMWAGGGVMTTTPTETYTHTSTFTSTANDNNITTNASTTKPTTSESVSVTTNTTANNITNTTTSASSSTSTSVSTTTTKATTTTPELTTTNAKPITTSVEFTNTEENVTTSEEYVTVTTTFAIDMEPSASEPNEPINGLAPSIVTTIYTTTVTTTTTQDDFIDEVIPSPDESTSSTNTTTLRNLNSDYTCNSLESMQRYPYTAVRFLLKNSQNGYYHDGKLDMDRLLNSSPFCTFIPNEDSVFTISQTDDYCDVVIFYSLYYDLIDQNVNMFANVSPTPVSESELIVPLICESFSTLYSDDVGYTLETLKIDNLSLKYLPIKWRINQISYLNS